MQTFLTPLLILSLLGATKGHQSSGFTFEVDERNEVCFYEDFEGSTTYIFEYRVIKGGNYDIDVSIKSPVDSEIFKKQRSSEGEFKFEISWGTYSFCFSNRFSTVTHKFVYFELRPEDHGRLAMEGPNNGPTANTQAQEFLESIHTAASDVMQMQVDYRLQESKGRNYAENLNWKVTLMSLAQSLLILIVGLGELITLKMFFTQKRVPLSQSKPSILTLLMKWEKDWNECFQ